MNEWDKFYGTTFLKKDNLYSNLNMEDVTDLDCNHPKRVCRDFEIKSCVKS